MNWIKNTEKTKSKLQNLTKSQSFDQIRAQNTSLDLITANKSKQQPKSSLKAGYKFSEKCNSKIQIWLKINFTFPVYLISGSSSSSEHQPGLDNYQ